MNHNVLFWAFCLVFCTSVHNVKPAAVMSVDFGSEWMKVGVVSPGVPMEIALNKESKRKTPAVVAFRDGERTFGEDATTIGVRFPKNSYAYLLDLLGKTVDHPLVQLYMKTFPYYKIETDPERSTPVFVHDDETKFTPEELVAQLLNKARDFAQTSTDQIITECVIIVPGFFNHAERMAMLEAAKLADLKVLQLINDHTAVALNYGIFRSKEMNESAQYVIFYDMGAHSTKVSVVEYKIVKTKERGFVESHPQLQVIGVGYDRTLGGLELTLRLRDHLAKKFNEMKKTPNDVTKNPRAMAKLLKEANRVKIVLSANADHYAQVEGLLDEQDFRVQVTREEFEAMCSDLFERITLPLNAALKSASLTLDVINQVILVGASTRMPKVQEILQKAVGTELGKSINTDEAAALGAVYRAADLSIGFKVKKFIIKDAVIFPIQVIFDREHEGNIKHVKRTLFGQMNPYPQKKVITFNKHTSDFSFYVNYAELDHLNADELKYLSSLNLSKVDLMEVADVLTKHQGPNIESKGIKAHFAMDDSGLLKLVNVELVAEKTLTPEELEEEEESSLTKLGNTISKFFGSDTASKDTVKDDKESQEKSEGTENATTEKPVEANNTEKAADKNATESAEKASKPKIIVMKEPIKLQEKVLSVPVLNDEQFKVSVNKLGNLDKQDEDRKKRETALNNLESFVIDTQSKLESNEYKKCGTPEEVENIIKECSETSQWLYDDGMDAEYTEYENKLKKLQKLSNNLFARHWEHKERPDALNALKTLLNGSSAFLKEIKNMTKETNPEKDIFTDVEIKLLSTKIEDIEKWRNEMVELQSKQKPHEEVVLTVASLADKMQELDREVKYLINKMKIWKPKKPPTTPKPEKKANETGDGETVIEPTTKDSSGSGSGDEETQVPKETVDKTTEGIKLEIDEQEDGESGDEHNEL